VGAGAPPPAARRRWLRRRSSWIALAAAVVVVAILAGVALLRGALSGGVDAVEFGALQQRGAGLNLPSPYSPYYAMSRAVGNRAYVGWVDDKRLRIAGLDLASGNPAWGPKDIPGTADKYDAMVATEAALVVVGEASSGTASRTLHVLDPKTGKHGWERTIDRDDTFFVFGSTLAIDSVKGNELHWYSLADGHSLGAVGDPREDSNWVATTTFAVSTPSDRAGPATADDGGSDPSVPGDDDRLVQVTADKRLRVVNRPGTPPAERSGVGDSSDHYLVTDGRLYVGTNESPYSVRAYSLDQLTAEPKIIYSSPDPKRRLDMLAPCGDGGVCMLDKASYDAKSAQVVSRGVDGHGKNWSRPAAGADKLLSVGDRALAVGGGSEVVSYLFDPAGKQLIVDTARYAVRVNARSLLLLNHAPSNSPGEINLLGMNADDGSVKPVGSPGTSISVAGCAWTESTLVCPTEQGFRVWRFTA
jgi:hypothetical protein